MALRSTRLAATLVLAAAFVMTTSQARAASQPIGAWDFSTDTAGPVAPGEAFGNPALYAAGDRTTLAVVKATRGPVLDVVSWRGLRPGAAVPRSASMLSTDRSFWLRSPWGSDGTSTAFDPGAGDFAVSVWVRPTDAQAYPRGTASVSSVSPNVVQKGKSDATGGYWKVALQMVRSTTGVVWAPECALRGGDGALVVANRGGAITLTPGVGADVRCARVGDRLTLTVVEDDGSVLSSSVAGAGALVVSNTAAVSVAHKPGTTSASDVYDGLLTDLVISRG